MKDSPAILPQRQKLPHTIPSWVGDGAIYFITVCCASRTASQLCLDSVATPIWESIEFRQKRGDWFVHLWRLMPDHLHALISFPREHDLAKVVSNREEIIAKKTDFAWQRDFFDHRLRSNESHQEKAHYIRQNPVRKGLVSKAEDWKFVREPN